MQSDFSVCSPHDAAVAEGSEPGASAPATAASALATRWVLRATIVLLFALAVLCAVGPHIPAGE
jgi:hypothetical protein